MGKGGDGPANKDVNVQSVSDGSEGVPVKKEVNVPYFSE